MKVFVYGTLKRGYANHIWLAENNAKFIKEDSIKGVMYSLGAYPMVDITETEGRVIGEVFEVTDACSKALDKLEGYPGFYDKQEVNTIDGQEVTVYCMPDRLRKYALEEIKSGEW